MEKARLKEVTFSVKVTQGLRGRVEGLDFDAPFVSSLPFIPGPVETLTLTQGLCRGGQGSTAEATGNVGCLEGQQHPTTTWGQSPWGVSDAGCGHRGFYLDPWAWAVRTQLLVGTGTVGEEADLPQDSRRQENSLWLKSLADGEGQTLSHPGW